MGSDRFWPFGLIGLAWVLTVAALVGFGGEAFLPGHHVHLGSEGHHHHFFVGTHDHGEDSQQQSSARGHDDHDGDCEYEGEAHPSVHGDAAKEGQGGLPEPAPEEGSNPGLIDGFSLYAPTVTALTASLATEERAAPQAKALAIVSHSRLPGGARAPPNLSLLT